MLFAAVLRTEKQKFWFGLLCVLLINTVFKLFFTPLLDQMGPYSLVNTPKWMDAVKKILSTDPLAILLPVQYPDTDGKVLWWTTTLIPFYVLNAVLSPLGVYVVTSSIFVLTVYVCSWVIFSSAVFSCTLATLLALGTYLNYALTYGVLLTLYFLLCYISINSAVCVRIIRAQNASFWLYFLFFISLLFCALGSEFWLNFAVSLLCILVFLIFWSLRHGNIQIKNRALILSLIVFLTLIFYLLIERQAAHKYFEAGVEEELIFTYTNALLMIDDLVVNYFTLLYMTLSNYLPSFLFFSNSVTYLGEARILTEQHGYHAQKTHLVVASHLFAWRFYAGILIAIFFRMGWKWFRSCWQEHTNPRALVLLVLWIAVATGFSTHLIIKMRPYNATPMLGYKAIFSTFSFTILIAYFIATSQKSFETIARWRSVVAGVLCVAFLAALTRPTAINAGLSAVGLVGYSDPAVQIMKFAKKIKHKLIA